MRPARRLGWAVAGLAGFWSLVQLWGLVGVAQAAGLRDIQDSWLVDRETAWVLLGYRPDPLARLALPQPALVLSCGQGLLFSQPELPQLEAGLRWRTVLASRAFTMDGSWRTLGQGVFRETAFSGKVSLESSPGFWMGMTRTAETLAGETVPARYVAAFGATGRWLLNGPLLLMAKVQFDFDARIARDFQPARRPFLEAALLGETAGLALGLDRRPDGTPVAGLDAFWKAGPGVGFSLRIDPATGVVGPGLQLRRGPLLLRTSHLVHPALGQTHRFLLCVVRAHG